jgi:RHS repeat-associated protein
LDIYGRVRTFAGRSLSECPFRYQGQYQDEETGLYYNRFLYYDAGVGSYISQYPIGLEGDNPTLYGYVHDPNTWIDIVELNIFSAITWTAPSIGTDNTYKVYQQDIDWDYVDPKTGKTNLELATRGRAPIGSDGMAINYIIQNSKPKAHCLNYQD